MSRVLGDFKTVTVRKKHTENASLFLGDDWRDAFPLMKTLRQKKAWVRIVKRQGNKLLPGQKAVVYSGIDCENRFFRVYEDPDLRDVCLANRVWEDDVC